MNVQVRQTTTGKGKGLFALRTLDPGTEILTEEPLVSCQFSWNSAYGYAACDHCMRPLETAEENASRLAGTSVSLPYPECCDTDKTKIVPCTGCGVRYCSDRCRTVAAERYHSVLCHRTTGSIHPLDKLNEAWKKCHYPPETNTVMLIIRLLARIVRSQDKDLAVVETLQFCHRTVNEEADLAHKLLGERFASQLDALYKLYVDAAPKDEAIDRFLTPEGFRSMLALIGTNAQGVGTSALSAWSSNAAARLAPALRDDLDSFVDALYRQLDERSGDFLDNDGVALYRLQSSCNHSCSPNARVSFESGDHRLALVALRPIGEGQEITISYLDECWTNRSRHSRRKELRANYLFECDCERCREEDGGSDRTSSEEEEEEEDEAMDE